MNPTTYTQIRILGEYFDIQWLPQRLLPDCLGQAQSDIKEIQLRDDLRGMQCLDTFLHEIFHVVSDKCNLELSEHQVHLLGMAWANLFYDNIELLGVMAEMMSQEDERRAITK